MTGRRRPRGLVKAPARGPDACFQRGEELVGGGGPLVHELGQEADSRATIAHQLVELADAIESRWPWRVAGLGKEAAPDLVPPVALGPAAPLGKKLATRLHHSHQLIDRVPPSRDQVQDVDRDGRVEAGVTEWEHRRVGKAHVDSCVRRVLEEASEHVTRDVDP